MLEIKFDMLDIQHFAFFVGVPGFEPGTSCSQSRRANRTALHPEALFFKSDAKVQLFLILTSVLSEKKQKISVFLLAEYFLVRKV